MTVPFSNAVERYSALIEAMIGTCAPFVAEVENPTTVQVERGVVHPLMLRGHLAAARGSVGRLIDLARSASLDRLAVVDRKGHQRPMYRALLVYAWVQAYEQARRHLPTDESAQWNEAIRAWGHLLEQILPKIAWDTTAARGANAAEACWSALALGRAGQALAQPAWVNSADRIFNRLRQSQQPSGAFLRTTASDNPETHWYHELVILHAVASYAAHGADSAMMAAIHQNAEFHQNETQPDHATTQPLAAFAFVVNPATRMLADQVLHAAQTQHPNGLDGVPAILLADALYGLRRDGLRRAAE